MDLIDDEVPVTTAEATAMMRALMRTEALGVGISSAANIVAALHVARASAPGTRVLTFACDGVHDHLEHPEDRRDTFLP